MLPKVNDQPRPRRSEQSAKSSQDGYAARPSLRGAQTENPGLQVLRAI